MRFFVPPAVFCGELQHGRLSHEVYSWSVDGCGDRRCGLRSTGRGALLLEWVRDGVRAPRLWPGGLLSPSHVPGLRPAVSRRLGLVPVTAEKWRCRSAAASFFCLCATYDSINKREAAHHGCDRNNAT